MEAISKTQLANELQVSNGTLRNYLKALCKRKDSPVKWEEIKNAKLFRGKVKQFILENI